MTYRSVLASVHDGLDGLRRLVKRLVELVDVGSTRLREIRFTPTPTADHCGELAHEIDTARAELARDRAEQQLRDLDRDEDAERYGQFEAALERARIRLEVGGGG